MKRNVKRKRGLLPILFLCICLITGILAAYMVWQELQDEAIQTKLEEDTIETYVEEPDDEPVPGPNEDNGSDGYVFDWNSLLAMNPEVIGWIRFDNPDRINYPIVQSTSNQKYLTRNWMGGYSSSGSIFLHKANDPAFTDQNSILYGHRMISGAMFGDLKQYRDQSYLDANPYFYIYTPDGMKRTYEIYLYAQVEDASDAYSLSFDSAEEKNTYFDKMKSRAITSRDVGLDEYDTIVTLSTCANYGYYNRIVVQGKLISIEVNQQP